MRARVGMGDLVIRVPQGVTVEADARSGAGQVELFGRQSDGLDVTRTTARDIGTGGGTLHLDADVGLGRVVVVRDPAPMAAVPKLGWDRDPVTTDSNFSPSSLAAGLVLVAFGVWILAGDVTFDALFPALLGGSGTDPARQRPREAALVSAPMATAAGIPAIDTEHRKLAGVCAGIARYYGIDVKYVRIAFVLLTILGGIGVALYGLAYLAMTSPESVELADPTAVVHEAAASWREGLGAGALAAAVTLVAGRRLGGRASRGRGHRGRRHRDAQRHRDDEARARRRGADDRRRGARRPRAAGDQPGAVVRLPGDRPARRQRHAVRPVVAADGAGADGRAHRAHPRAGARRGRRAPARLGAADAGADPAPRRRSAARSRSWRGARSASCAPG